MFPNAGIEGMLIARPRPRKDPMARWGAKSAALSETDRNKDAIFCLL